MLVKYFCLHGKVTQSTKTLVADGYEAPTPITLYNPSDENIYETIDESIVMENSHYDA